MFSTKPPAFDPGAPQKPLVASDQPAQNGFGSTADELAQAGLGLDSDY